MSIAAQLATAPGHYLGSGDGQESGRFVARIGVNPLPNGGVSIDYEAISHDDEVLHCEHTMLSAGADDRDRLFIAHQESPVITEMVETEPGSGHFVQPSPAGPIVMEIVIELPEPGHITYAWRWAPAGEPPQEQSKADVRLLS